MEKRPVTIKSEMADALRASLKAEFTDESIKRIKKFVNDLTYEIETDIEYRLKEDMAAHLSGVVADMATRTIEAIINGNESEMRRYLSCDQGQWNGRDRERPVIHGTLFESGPITLRRQMAEANPELLRDERILDLEAQVRSLVEQVKKANERADRAEYRANAA